MPGQGKAEPERRIQQLRLVTPRSAQLPLSPQPLPPPRTQQGAGDGQHLPTGCASGAAMPKAPQNPMAGSGCPQDEATLQ